MSEMKNIGFGYFITGSKSETIHNNMLIAKFIGWTQDQEKKHYWYAPNEYRQFSSSTYRGKDGCVMEKLKFHASWDWLMPVVDKIDKMQIFDSVEYRELSEVGIFAKIDIVYEYVVEFIKWYNESDGYRNYW